MTELWRDVVGFEDRYRVSSYGRVLSTRYRGNGDARCMKATRNYAGYRVVTLGGCRSQRRVSVLVLEAFVGPRPSGMQACHNDSDKDNNRLDNLRWDTPKGNIADRRSYVGAANPSAKLSDQQRHEIIHRRRQGERLAKLAGEYGVSTNRVSQLALAAEKEQR